MEKQLRIGVDIRDLKIAKTGTKTYLEEIFKAFKYIENQHVKFIFLDDVFDVYTGKNSMQKWAAHFKYQLWKQLILPLKAWLANCDVVFCTDNIVPLLHLGFQTIPVFHDAFFFENPENYGRLWLWVFKKTALPAAKRSPFIVVPTAYAKKQIHHFTKIDQKKLVVIHEGPKTFINQQNAADSASFLKKLNLAPSNYILHVGSFYKRKNLPALIKAFGKLKKTGYPDLKLVLAGSPPSNGLENDVDAIQKAIETSGEARNIVLTGFLSDEQLNVLYANAILYVFPSVNEGFGLPVLEAFAHNLPVLAANNSCLPEVGGDAVLLFDPFNTNNIFDTVKTALDDAELRQQMTRSGQQRLTDFSWIKTASQLVEVFKKSI